MRLSLLLLLLAAPSRALTWEDCVREAAAAHPRLLAAREALSSAQAGRREAFADWLPDLSLSASQSRSKSAGAAAADSMRAGPRLGWNLFAGFATRAAVQQAASQALRSEAQLKLEEADRREELRRSFGRLLYAQETVGLADSIARRLQENASFVRLKYDGGVEARWGWLKAQADAADAQWDLDRAKRDLEAAQRELARALGRPDPEGLRAEGVLSVPGPEALPGALSGLEAHPSLVAQLHTLAQAEARLLSARSGRWPSLDLSASLDRSGGSWSLEREGWSLGASLSYPLFQGGAVEAAVEGRSRDLSAERQRTVGLRQDLRAALATAHASYASAAERLAVEKALLEVAVERHETVATLYANGQARFLDWDAAQTALTSSQRSELAARRSAYEALASFERAKGEGLP